MIDTRFHPTAGPLTLGALVEGLAAQLPQGEDKESIIHGVAPLDKAQEGDLTFFHSPQYLPQLKETKATACVVPPEYAQEVPEGIAVVISSKPYRVFAQMARRLYPVPRPAAVISPLAFIHPQAVLGKDVTIGPFAVIEAGVSLEDEAVVGSHTVIHENVVVGKGTVLESHVTLSHALVGARVLIKTGARVGQKGFGFDMDGDGFLTIPQLGRVILEDDVEIGANTTVDRGSAGDTIIGRGTRLDNQIQVGHNVKIGQMSVLAAQVGIAGSTEVGNGVLIGGQAGLAGHLKVGDRAMMAARSAIMRDVAGGEKIAGCPGLPAREHFRETIALAKLAKTRGYK